MLNRFATYYLLACSGLFPFVAAVWSAEPAPAVPAPAATIGPPGCEDCKKSNSPESLGAFDPVLARIRAAELPKCALSAPFFAKAQKPLPAREARWPNWEFEQDRNPLSLPSGERRAISYWIGAGHTELNYGIARGRAEWTPASRELKAALRKLPAHDGVVIHRQRRRSVLFSVKAGQTVVTSTFFSSSLKPTVSFFGDQIVAVYSKQGRRLEDYSVVGEDEVLFMPGTRLRSLGIQWDLIPGRGIPAFVDEGLDPLTTAMISNVASLGGNYDVLLRQIEADLRKAGLSEGRLNENELVAFQAFRDPVLGPKLRALVHSPAREKARFSGILTVLRSAFRKMPKCAGL